MGEAFITRRGGGAALNFKIVGGTAQPTSASENTIWVNTSNAITSWIFSAETPTSPTAGMVWIRVDSESPAAFNALKKNGLYVYPVSAMQYVSGAWTSKVAKFYKANTWIDFGNYIQITSDIWRNNVAGTGGSMSISNGVITLIANAGTANYGGISVVITNEPQDLNGYNKFCVRAKGSEGSEFQIGIHDNADDTYEGWLANLSQIAGNEYNDYYVDISHLTTGHLAVMCASAVNIGSRTLIIEKVWLE